MKRTLLMLGLWLAWVLLQRSPAKPTLTHEDDGLEPLGPVPFPSGPDGQR